MISYTYKIKISKVTIWKMWTKHALYIEVTWNYNDDPFKGKKIWLVVFLRSVKIFSQSSQ